MKKERRYIIVDEDNKPMSWSKRDRQICYNSKIGRTRFKLKHYRKEDAEQFIIETVGNRLKWKMSPGRYYLMQIEL